jgi:hypothetical protein
MYTDNVSSSVDYLPFSFFTIFHTTFILLTVYNKLQLICDYGEQQQESIKVNH